MSTLERPVEDPAPDPTGSSGLRWRLLGLAALGVALVVGVTAWAVDGSVVGRWLATHTGTDDLSGPWYGFWSGFGSDLAEFGLIGAVATAAYQVVRKFNCHEPRCWRVGTHPAAGGQFLLCYRHHPDFQGRPPTHEMIERMHREHLARLAAVHDRIHGVHEAVPAAPAPSGSTRGGSTPVGDGPR